MRTLRERIQARVGTTVAGNRFRLVKVGFQTSRPLQIVHRHWCLRTRMLLVGVTTPKRLLALADTLSHSLPHEVRPMRRRPVRRFNA
jgi:hypothetical protein